VQVDPEQIKTIVMTVVASNVVAPPIQEVMKGIIASARDKWRSIDESVDFALWSAAALHTAYETPPERLIAPSPQILGPVAMALVNTAMDDTLQQMFITLLATAMDSDTQMKAHPAYAEILRQLTPLEARLLQVLATQLKTMLTLYKIVYKPDDIILRQHITDLGDEMTPKADIPENAIDNLERVGILTIHRHAGWPTEMETVLTNSVMVREMASWSRILRESREMSEPLAEIQGRMRIGKYNAEITAFGMEFLDAITSSGC
jgi:hypothetical protein